MKKFSDTLEQDREFEFLGELFKWRYVHWTVIAGIVDGPQTNGKDPEEPTAASSVQELIDLIPEFIDPENEGVDRIKALLTGEKRPVPIGQINALYEWLLEVTSGRPTEKPSPSEAGRGRTAPSSKAK